MKLKVVNIQQETKDAVSISFQVAEELKEQFSYKAGQYLTLEFNLNGEEVRRSYSLCSSPKEDTLRIGVKRVKGGLVSNYINDHIQVGDEIEVLPPDGRFYADVKPENYKTYYLFSAGSGITPIFSILKTVLQTEPHSFVHLIYGNKSQESIIFKEELEQLQEQFPERFVVIHCLSKPKTNWFSSKKEFAYRKGRVDQEAILWFMNEYPPYAQNVEYFICGPGKMIENTKQVLQQIDVPNERIFVENFGGGQEETIQAVANAKLTATLNNEEIQTTITEGRTVLRALIDNGNQPPYSCEGGVCSTCMCKLIEGEVKMKKNLALTEKQVEEGYILSCQSIPTSETIKVQF